MQRTGSATEGLLPELSVVLDHGSSVLRAGFASGERPSLIMPAVVGRPKVTKPSGGAEAATPGRSSSAELGKDELLFGDVVLENPDTLRRSYPVCWGLMLNWDDLTHMWRHVFERKLECGTMENTPLVVMESAYMVPKITREKQTQLAFETFDVPAFCLAPGPTAVLLSVERETGLLIDIGAQVVRVIPVYNGYSLPHAIMKFDIGSDYADDYLRQLLSEKGTPVDLVRSEQARRMKESLAYVAQDYKAEKETFSVSQEKTFTLPSGEILTLGRERFQCVEFFFQPSLLGMEIPGLAEHIVLTVFKCAAEIRQQLLSNVVLVGGGSRLPGLASRLQHEVEKELRGHAQPDLRRLHVQVVTPPDPDLIVWQGGSRLVHNPYFPQLCITKDEYDECGPMIVHRKY